MTKEVWGLREGDHIAEGVVALKPLGGGISYEAWVGFDERLYTPVVVKVLRPDAVENEAKRADFAREVRLLEQLKHPSIVRLFHADAEAERPHMILENVDGPNLSKLIGRHGPLPIQQLVPLAIELGAAAHYLRLRGVCHLDIKPSNVIMGAPAKLIDFSIARTTDVAAQTTYPIGSHQYMAPEQCQPGERGVMTPASDMWGIGTTLFRAAVGRRAFTTGDPQAADPLEKWPQLTESHRDIPDFVAPAFAKLMLACLDHDAGARPEPAEFVDAMEPLMANLPQARLSGFSLKL